MTGEQNGMYEAVIEQLRAWFRAHEGWLDGCVSSKEAEALWLKFEELGPRLLDRAKEADRLAAEHAALVAAVQAVAGNGPGHGWKEGNEYYVAVRFEDWNRLRDALPEEDR